MPHAVSRWTRAVTGRRVVMACAALAIGIACTESIVEPVVVSRVDIAGGGASLRLGQSAQLNATLRSAEGWPLPASGITWSSSDASVATVSTSGQVTALKRGTATISAAAAGVSGTAAVTVVGVQAVAIPQDTLAVVVQAQGSVTATVTADPGVAVLASWVARDTSVVRVDTTGRITARKLGTTWVVASAEVARDSVKVVVIPVPVTPPASGAAGPVTTTVLGGAVSLTIPPGATTAPTLTVAPVPTAPSDNRIPAGLAYVFGPAGTQFSTPITLSVGFDPAQIPTAKRPLLRLHLVDGTTVTEVPGGAVDLSNNRVTAPVTHFSTYAILVPSDPTQLAVTAGAGQTAFVDDEVPTAPSVTVRDAQGRPVARAKVSFDVTAGAGRLRNGASQSSDTATTDANGVATLVAAWRMGSSAGANTLTVKVFTAAGAQAATTTITATAQDRPVSRVVVSPDSVTVVVGATRQLTAVPYDDRDTVLIGRTVTWSSSNTAVATVSSAGLVTAVALGTATITATSENKSGTATLTIAPAFYLAANGITVLCPSTGVGTSGVVNGVTYTKRSRAQLDALIAAGDFASVSTTCTSGITDMSQLFRERSTFNAPLNSWDVSDVVTMRAMFERALAFNQPLGAWNTENVVDMSSMFLLTPFNQPIGNWNTANVSNMSGMFHIASTFNQPLGTWNTGNVTNMSGMFHDASSFNQPIGGWNTSQVATMQFMFTNATAFNQSIVGWDVSKVSSMVTMFYGAVSFNRDLSGWCVSGIAAEPNQFTYNTPSWTLPKPVWGSCSRASTVQSTVSANPSTIVASPSASTTITIQLKDAAGNNLTASAGALTFDTPSQGSVSSVVDNGDGSYSATYVAGSTPGSVTLVPRIDGGQKVLPSVVVTLTPAFYLATNGITVLCPDAVVGATGIVDGVTYTKRSRAQLDALVGAGNFAPLQTTCTSGITDLSRLFFNQATFNTPIGSWDVSSVRTLSETFHGASIFNQPLAAWNTSNVLNMAATFAFTTLFNQPIGDWNTSNVVTMANMFFFSGFNQPIGGWDTRNVQNMGSMFYGSSQFNQPINGWDTGRVTSMEWMFNDTGTFDQPLNNWNVSQGTNMNNMFRNAAAFNRDLSNWCVSRIPAEPVSFSTGAGRWSLPKPIWGTCPTP